VKICVIDADTSHTPEEGAPSPSWPNELIIIISIIIFIIIITKWWDRSQMKGH
jgi:hypothetical protein